MSKPNEEMDSIEGISEKQAGYMELAGAKKDAGCKIVNVKDGVSSKRGCCNLFEYRRGAAILFSCGTCEYVRKK